MSMCRKSSFWGIVRNAAPRTGRNSGGVMIARRMVAHRRPRPTLVVARAARRMMRRMTSHPFDANIYPAPARANPFWVWVRRTLFGHSICRDCGRGVYASYDRCMYCAPPCPKCGGPKNERFAQCLRCANGE